MNKKSMAALLAAAMVFGLAACGGGAEPTEPAPSVQIPDHNEITEPQKLLNEDGVLANPGWARYFY